MAGAAREIREARREQAWQRAGDPDYRCAFAASDRAIARLEESNLQGRGGCRPDATTRAALDEVLALVPDAARRRAHRWRTVQQALDGLFDIQEALQAERRRDRYGDEFLPD